MKASIYSALFAIAISLSASVHAIPPVPPTPIKSEPVVIICKHDLALTEEEIQEINNDIEKFVSFNEQLREICFKK